MVSGPGLARFQDDIMRLVKDGINNLVVDFSKVTWFGSPMLGVLTASLTTLRSMNGDLRLTGVSKKVQSIMKVTGLAEKLGTQDTVAYSPRAKRIVEILAVEEARVFNAEQVSTSHLLLALVKDRDGVAGQVLASLGVEYQCVKLEIEN